MIYDIRTLYPFHQSVISHIKLIMSNSTCTVSVSSHTVYWSYNPHCTYDNTGTIYVPSYEYIWHHIHSLIYHITLWHSHTLYKWHHTQDTCHRIHCSWAITYSVLLIAHLQYVWYQTHSIYDIIWFYVTSPPHFMISQDCIHHIISTLLMISHPLYMTSHTLYLWHHSHCNYEKTPTMFLTLYSVYKTSHMVNDWQHNECIWHDT